MSPTSTAANPLLIVGAGPIGLAAAAQASSRGLPTVVLEAGPAVGSSVLEWGHVRLFSAWRELVDPAAEALLLPTGWRRPDPDSYPTGREWVEDYLAPLAVGARGHRSGGHPGGSPRGRRRQAGPRPSGGLRPGRGRLHGAGRGRPRYDARRGERRHRRLGHLDRTQPAGRRRPARARGAGGRRPDHLRHPGLRRPGRADPVRRQARRGRGPGCLGAEHAGRPGLAGRRGGGHRGRLAAPSPWHR